VNGEGVGGGDGERVGTAWMGGEVGGRGGEEGGGGGW